MASLHTLNHGGLRTSIQNKSKKTNGQTDKRTNRHTDKQANKQTDRQTNGQTNKQTDKQRRVLFLCTFHLI